MHRQVAVLLCVCVLFLGTKAEAGPRLDAIKQRGFVTCGVGDNVPGFSRVDARGQWSGFDVDICRAIAAALFGDPAKVTFKPIDILPNFLRSNDIDLVLRGLTWTFAREARGELRYGPIVLYDGQSFLVPKRLNVQEPAQLSGKTICMSLDAEFVSNIRVYFREHNLTFRAVIKDRRFQAEDAFFAGECDAFTADSSELAEAVIGKAPRPDDFVILPQQISKEPLAPLLRKDDEQFFDVVRWTIFALINAEELGITAANVERMRASEHPEVRFFFAAPPAGTPGLAAGWSANAIRAAGNYGEIFDRHLGANSAAKMPRGLSKLWSQGGLLYAPPVK